MKAINLVRLILVLFCLIGFSANISAIEYLLRADVTTVTMPDGAVITMWGFADDTAGDGTGTVTVPGPKLTVPPGDTELVVRVKNNLTPARTGLPMGCPVCIVIPGLPAQMTPVRFGPAPYPEFEGRIRSLTHETPPDNNTVGEYRWTNLRAGTYAYHSGTHVQCHVQMGLYGALTIDHAAGEAYPGITYDKDLIVFYSEIDPAFHQAVATNNYGPGKTMTSTIDYDPKYFLVNGKPFVQGQLPLEAGNAGETILLRFINMGLETHVPTLQNNYIQLVAEDANLYPYQKEQYSVTLPASKTIDALFVPDAEKSYPLYDRRLFLTNNESSPGGFFSYLDVIQSGAPTAVGDNYVTNEDVTLNVSAPGVLGNDTGTGTLTAIVETLPAHGTLTLNANGSLSYVPSANYFGTDSFTYRAQADGKKSHPAPVSITVNSVNDPPIAVNDLAITTTNVPITVNVIANDYDVDGTINPASLVITNPPVQGTAVANPNGTITYTPPLNFRGLVIIMYKVSDNNGAQSNLGWLQIRVNR